MAGTLFVVATPIGNLEDITARAIRILRDATLIAAEDTRRTAHLLARYAITTPTTSLHEHVEASKAASLVARLQRGDNIALVSDAGTPTISDPGERLIRDAHEAGIRGEAVPAPRPAGTAPSAAEMLSELGEMTAGGAISRRAAVNALARRHRLPPNQVYAAIEEARKSGKRQKA